MKRFFPFLIIGAVALLTVGTAAVMYRVKTRPAPAPQAGTAVAATPAEAPENPFLHVRGPRNAPVTLEIYGDFQCPPCALASQAIDELQKQYVVTARAKGLPPLKLLFKYPLRMALNPFISDIGSLLPHVISGAAIVSVVMSLPTTGPMLLEALRSQDMYLAGSFLMFMAFLTVIGVFVSDLALAVLDPRIRLQAGRHQ